MRIRCDIRLERRSSVFNLGRGEISFVSLLGAPRKKATMLKGAFAPLLRGGEGGGVIRGSKTQTPTQTLRGVGCFRVCEWI